MRLIERLRRLLAKRPSPIVVPQAEAIPGVCGTAMHHIHRSHVLNAMLEALESEAIPRGRSVEVTLVPTREVEGEPFPWRFQIMSGTPPFVEFAALGSSVTLSVPSPPSGDTLVLEVHWGPNLAKKSVPVDRGV